MRGGLARALLVLAVGAVLTLLAGVRPWLTGREELPEPLPPREVLLAAADVAPGVRAVGVLGLAGLVAVLAARGWLRVAVGALLALAGLAAAALAVGVLRDPALAAAGADAYGEVALREGPLLALAGGAVLVVGGALVALRSRGWPALGRRYDAPAAPVAAPQPVTERELWESLDAGLDPTARPDPDGQGGRTAH